MLRDPVKISPNVKYYDSLCHSEDTTITMQENSRLGTKHSIQKNDIFHAKLGTFKDPSCYFSHLSLIRELTWERLATRAASSQKENTSWSLFQAPPMISRCCRQHAREIKHFLKSKTQGTSYTMSFSYFIHSENIWAKKSALRPESATFIGRFNVSIRGKMWSSFVAFFFLFEWHRAASLCSN